jgi:hypothetical protein
MWKSTHWDQEKVSEEVDPVLISYVESFGLAFGDRSVNINEIKPYNPLLMDFFCDPDETLLFGRECAILTEIVRSISN